jgi:16S rRNA (cytosine967-C5)-methyltransferase
LLAARLGDVRALAAHASGELTVQEEGSQLVACYLGARPGEQVADLCAGHGGKTTLLAEQVGASGRVVALELDERKLERIGEELRRLGLPDARVERCAVDLSVGTGGLGASFDRVLLDAPCTGLGTLHRRPELLTRLQQDDPERLAGLQLALARSASRLVRPGGVLVIAVCSISRAEGAELCARFLGEHPSFALEHEAPPESASLRADADGLVRIGPWLYPGSGSPDAYQMLRLRHRA